MLRTRIRDESGTALGGYTGFYPGFAPDIKAHLKKLGASETLSASPFELSASGSAQTGAACQGQGQGGSGRSRSNGIVNFAGTSTRNIGHRAFLLTAMVHTVSIYVTSKRLGALPM